jgi:ethanolamine ammonia-lyase small subunit
MKAKRIPRKQIVMKFKDGMSITALAIKYLPILGNVEKVSAAEEIIEIIREYMRKQKS